MRPQLMYLVRKPMDQQPARLTCITYYYFLKNIIKIQEQLYIWSPLSCLAGYNEKKIYGVVRVDPHPKLNCAGDEPYLVTKLE